MKESHMKAERPDKKAGTPNAKLKQAREQRGWTHGYVAANIGLGNNYTVSRWERGAQFPSLDYREKLSSLFKMEKEDLGLIKTSVQAPALVIPKSHNSHRKPIYTIPHNIPPCIGREEEIAHVCELLQQSSVRLVTLVGPGGIGKTFLANEIVTKVHTHFPDGVCFISLSDAQNIDQVQQTIINALGMKKSKRLPPLEQIKRFLHEKNLLLFLDTVEHIIGVISLVESLIHFCPHLKILVTSREARHLHMEKDIAVRPLPVPDLTHLPEPNALIDNLSVALFVYHVQNRLQSFQVTKENAHDIAKLCIRLDGLPLAIELAASLIKLLPPHELVERLSQRSITLKNTTLPERHQTLDNAIKWSYDLLNTQEKWLFRQISVFAGGTSLKIIENILETGEKPTLNILDCINSLIDKSLLYSNCSPENKFSRITMLETTRDFAINCLRDTNELELISSLHAMYYLDMVEEAAPSLKKPQQDEQLQIFKSEQANLRDALKWLIDHKETAAALRFCEAFGKFCGLYGYWSEEQHWLQVSLELPQIPESKAIRAKVLRRAGHLAYRLRNFMTAETFFKESLTISRAIEDKQNLAGALSGLGWVLYKQNKKDDAHLYLQESVEAARMSGDAWTIANTLDSWGRYAHDQGNISEASAYLQESVTIAQDLQDKETEVRILRTLVTMEIQQKHEAQAIELARESSDLAQQLGTTPIIALSHDILGDVALFKKEYEQAKCHFEKSIALARDLGDKPAAASRYLKLVDIALCQEDTQTILTFLQNSSKLFQKVYDIPAMAAIQIRCQKYIEEKKKSGLPV